jgi:Flp pilus assembly pilin Flp
MFVGFRVDSNALKAFQPFQCAQRALEKPKGGESHMLSFTDLSHYLRARFGVEEGQTMAEYGVVLAVIALGVVVALGALSGAISAAINEVTTFL